MKTRTFLIAALYLLAACAKDEGADGSNQPGNETGDETPQETSISFTADIPAFVKGESRTTVDNNWSELLNPAVAVEIDGVVKAYTVDVKGSLTVTKKRSQSMPGILMRREVKSQMRHLR